MLQARPQHPAAVGSENDHGLTNFLTRNLHEIHPCQIYSLIERSVVQCSLIEQS